MKHITNNQRNETDVAVCSVFRIIDKISNLRITKILISFLASVCWLIKKFLGLILVAGVSFLAVTGIYLFLVVLIRGVIIEHSLELLGLLVVLLFAGGLCAFFGSIFWCLGFMMLTGIDLPARWRNRNKAQNL
jgi:hypothetical protein